ncbi:MAG: permease [Candidatus Gracilibacteria bacterium]
MDIFYPIQVFADFIVYNLLNISGHLGESLNFFIVDSIKIVFLLMLITQVMSFVNVIFPIEKVRNFLGKRKLFGLEYLLSSLFGAITPFCTCSSIPLFVGFLKGGIPLGVTFAFLITSPLVNEVAVAMFLGIFGLKVTLIYMFSGIVLGVIGGMILGKMNLEKYIAPFVLDMRNKEDNREVEIKQKSGKQIWKESSKEGWDITKKVLPYVLLGVGLGAIIHGFVPTGFFERHITADNPFAVPIAVIIGIPMYANATSIIPIVEALISKGIPLGTGLAFMMAVVGLSLPEFLILKKVMKIQLLLIFFGMIGFFMILLGYFFNLVL